MFRDFTQIITDSKFNPVNYDTKATPGTLTATTGTPGSSFR